MLSPIEVRIFKLFLILGFGLAWALYFPSLTTFPSFLRLPEDDRAWNEMTLFALTGIVAVISICWLAKASSAHRSLDPPVRLQSRLEYIVIGAALGFAGVVRSGTPIALHTMSQSMDYRALMLIAVLPLIFISELCTRVWLQSSFSARFGWRVSALICAPIPALVALAVGVHEAHSLALLICIGGLLAIIYQFTSDWINTSLVTSGWVFAIIAFSLSGQRQGPFDWQTVSIAISGAIDGSSILLPSLICILFTIMLERKLSQSSIAPEIESVSAKPRR